MKQYETQQKNCVIINHYICPEARNGKAQSRSGRRRADTFAGGILFYEVSLGK